MSDYVARAQANADLTRRIHNAAFQRSLAFGVGLWDKFPPGVAARILENGIVVEDIDFDDADRVIVLGADGQLWRADRIGVDLLS